MQTRRAAFGVLLVAVLLLSVISTACSSTAAIKVTVKDMAGTALDGITVTVGDKTATTDASGQATVKGVAPGQVTIKLAGGGYDTEKTETAQKGNNEFTYQLSQSFAFRDFAEIDAFRMKVAAPGPDGPVEVEGTFVRGAGTHWIMESDVEIVHLGDVVYFKAGPGQNWERFAGMGQMNFFTEALMGMANQFMGELQAFDAHLGDDSIQAQWQRNEEANGYDCNVFTVNWSDNSNSGSYTVYVIAQGDAKGFVTRSQWSIEGFGNTTYDVYDINADLTVEAPI